MTVPSYRERPSHDFRKLQVWQRAIGLAARIDALTETVSMRRRRKRCDQMTSAAESIHSSIAEGSGSGTNANFARYLQISIGSASELESQLAFLRVVGAAPPDACESLIDDMIEIRKMLIGLQRRIRNG